MYGTWIGIILKAKLKSFLVLRYWKNLINTTRKSDNFPIKDFK